jgi:hypothetical protein
MKTIKYPKGKILRNTDARIPVTTDELNAMKSEAHRNGMTLAAWARSLLLRAARENGTGK